MQIVVLFLPQLCVDAESMKYEMAPGNTFISRTVGNYFNVQLVKTVDLPPENKNNKYIFGIHPHGILPFGGGCAMFTNYAGFLHKFPGISKLVLTASICYLIPFYREFLFSIGGRGNLFVRPDSCLSCPFTLLRYRLPFHLVSLDFFFF